MTIKWILTFLLVLPAKQAFSSTDCDYPHEYENVETVCECIPKMFPKSMFIEYIVLFRIDCKSEKAMFVIVNEAWIETFNGSADYDSLLLLDTTNTMSYVPKKIFTGLPNLQTVRLGGFSWSTLPAWSFHNHSAWTELILARVGIHEIEENAFVNLSELTTLAFYFNNISHLRNNSFANLPKLKQLALEYNHIRDIDDDFFVNLKNLEEIGLMKNHLTRVDRSWWRGLAKLKELHVGGNYIKILNKASFGNIPFLKKLMLSRNNIKNISKGTFSGVPQLELLDLSMNSLETVDEDILEGLENLQSILLYGNNLKRFSYAAGVTFKKIKPYVQFGIDLICDCDFKWIYDICQPPARCSMYPLACIKEDGSLQATHDEDFSLNLDCPDQ